MTMIVQYNSGNGQNSEKSFPTGVVIETDNARYNQRGPFRQDNLAASAASVALTFGATDANAPTEVVMGRSGTIIGVIVRGNAVCTAGTADFFASLNGAAVGSAAQINSVAGSTQQRIVDYSANPINFVAGDRIGVRVTSNGAFAPVTIEYAASFMFRWIAT